ncbi:MAG: tetratricopeptide repeat protein [Crocinitomicaceae bacterium]|nr:tetratricopeptide repeat protein [Crocinitomicaceae bacterium]
MEAKILLGEGKYSETEKILEELSSSRNLADSVCFELGKLYMNFNKFESALKQFQRALDLKPEKAKYHQSIATCYLRLDKVELALDHALTSIDLVRYFPAAHYTIGQALERLGDIENAKKAYATAEKLRPTMVRAKMAVENLSKTDVQTESKEDVSSDFPEIIIVSGLPRSGTSMMMQMLDGAELPILTDGLRKKDSNNPKGYFEYEKVKSLHKSNDWLAEGEGKVIKVIVQLIKYLPKEFRYKIILMTRSIDEILESQRIMIGKRTPPKLEIKRSFEKEINSVEKWSRLEPGVELIKIAYRDTINHPQDQAEKVAEFLNRDLDIEKMVDAVDSTLYHNRIYKFEL